MAVIARNRPVVPEPEDSGINEFTEETTHNPSQVTRAPSVSSGWVTYTPGSFTKTVKAPYVNLKDLKKHIIKILDEAPPVRWRVHWLASTRTMVTCLRMWDDEGRLAPLEECPLCVKLHKASPKMMLNVIDLSDDREEVKTLTFGPEIGNTLQDYSKVEDDNGNVIETIPLNREDRYFKIQRVDVPRTSYKVELIKARDLFEDHRKEPLSSEEIAEVSQELYGAETLWIYSFDKVQEYADGLTPGDFQKSQ